MGYKAMKIVWWIFLLGFTIIYILAALNGKLFIEMPIFMGIWSLITVFFWWATFNNKNGEVFNLTDYPYKDGYMDSFTDNTSMLPQDTIHITNINHDN